jgi:hypothetical protein
LLGKRNSSNSPAKNLAPIHTVNIKNKDLLEVQLSPTANTFSKADLAFEAQAPKITNKVYSHSTTNFTNSNSEGDPQPLNKSKTKLIVSFELIRVININAKW